MATAAASSPLSGLAHLAKAPNKAAVLKAFNRAFFTRDESAKDLDLQVYVSEFGLSEEEARELNQGMLAVIKPVLYTGDVSTAAS